HAAYRRHGASGQRGPRLRDQVGWAAGAGGHGGAAVGPAHGGRTGCLRPVSRLVEQSPAALIIYDILRIGDSWLLDVNWDERRDILTRAVVPTPGARV